jgi:hypothetical protein
MNLQEFHLSRRMFCIIDGKILIAPEKSTLSHKEWLESLGLDGEVEKSVRGFADDRGLFYYRGKGFLADPATEKEFMRHLKSLAEAMKLPPTTQVFGGVTATKDARYPPRKKHGTIAALTGR